MNAGKPTESGPRAHSLELLGRAIALIEEVSVAHEPLGVTALARRTGIPKATTHRLLAILLAHRLLARQAGGFGLGQATRRLARLASDRTTPQLRHLLMPYLVELYERTGDMAILGVLDVDTVVILEAVHGHRHERAVPPLDRIPAHCSAIGKLLLAHRRTQAPPGEDRLTPCTSRSVTSWAALAAEFPGIRARGFATCHSELMPHLTESALPLIGRDGTVAGLGRIHHSRPPDEAAAATHRRIAIAASAALRRATVPASARRA
jgi:IclR family KDG regulon transcriptional repressor